MIVDALVPHQSWPTSNNSTKIYPVNFLYNGTSVDDIRYHFSLINLLWTCQLRPCNA